MSPEPPRPAAPTAARRPALAVLPLVALVLCACTEPAPPSDRLPQVMTVQAGAPESQGERVLAASVMARHESPLGFRTAGRVASRKVEVGQRVEAGQVLGELDPGDYAIDARLAEAQRQAAEVELRQAERDAARFGRLGAEGALGSAEEERQKARSAAAAARLDAAQQQAELAHRRAGYATLVAPFAGVVTQVQFEPGLSVTEGQPVLRLSDAAELEVVADVPVDLQAGLARTTASASAPAETGARVPLRLREVAPQANPATRTVQARFSLAGAVPPALAATVALGRAVDLHLAPPEAGPAGTTALPATVPHAAPPQAASGAGVQVLPAGALVQAGGDPFVYRVDPASGIVVRQPVQVLGYAADVVEVRGLPEGSRVVAAGVQRLHEGMKVVAVERSTSGIDMAPAVITAPQVAPEAILAPPGVPAPGATARATGGAPATARTPAAAAGAAPRAP